MSNFNNYSKYFLHSTICTVPDFFNYNNTSGTTYPAYELKLPFGKCSSNSILSLAKPNAIFASSFGSCVTYYNRY